MAGSSGAVSTVCVVVVGALSLVVLAQTILSLFWRRQRVRY